MRKEETKFLESFPAFEKVSERPIIYEGELDIRDTEGVLYDRFHISIDIPEDYPNSIPIIHELDNRIPREEDRHINVYSGNSCCLCLPVHEKLFIRHGYDLVKFVEQMVIPFFANQVYYERTEEWANGDYAHGNKGIRQFYTEAFKTDDFNQIIYGLKISTGQFQAPLDFTRCFCGKNIPYSMCHKGTIEFFRFIGVEIIRNDFKALTNNTV